jgi:hypothetical protein
LISTYADLAIGLALAFLLLSLLVSGINEGMVRLLGVRAKFLWAYLRDTLHGGTAETGPVLSRIGRVVARLSRLPVIGGFFGRSLRDFLPAQAGSRLPGTVPGVFLKLPFIRDARPRFTAEPAPGEIPTTGSLTDAFYQRIQEIDHGMAGRTAIADIPPARFGVAIVELAMGHGGVPGLLRRLNESGSPLYRRCRAPGKAPPKTSTPSAPERSAGSTARCSASPCSPAGTPAGWSP